MTVVLGVVLGVVVVVAVVTIIVTEKLHPAAATLG